MSNKEKVAELQASIKIIDTLKAKLEKERRDFFYGFLNKKVGVTFLNKDGAACVRIGYLVKVDLRDVDLAIRNRGPGTDCVKVKEVTDIQILELANTKETQ